MTKCLLFQVLSAAGISFLVGFLFSNPLVAFDIHKPIYFSATEAHDDDGLPHTLEHLVKSI